VRPQKVRPQKVRQATIWLARRKPRLRRGYDLWRGRRMLAKVLSHQL
jgi:hypothetical protein